MFRYIDKFSYYFNYTISLESQGRIQRLIRYFRLDVFTKLNLCLHVQKISKNNSELNKQNIVFAI